MAKIVATICARGGSKGLPRKNCKLLHGKPLICYTIEQALSCDLLDQVIVSTDDEEIAIIAQAAGAMVPFLRPAVLSGDGVPKRDAILHAVQALEKTGPPVDVIVDLDVTAPLREMKDIHACVKLLTPEVDLVMSGYSATKNPYFNMVEINPEGFIGLSKFAGKIFPSRQTAPKVYALNGSVYVWHRHTLERDIWDNKHIKIYEMPENQSIDIDTPLDWKLVELLMQEKMAFSQSDSVSLVS